MAYIGFGAFGFLDLRVQALGGQGSGDLCWNPTLS